MTEVKDTGELDIATEAFGISGRILVREGPKAVAWLETKFMGEKIVVVGPPGAGKTSFIEFLRYGVPVRPGVSAPTTTHTERAHAVFRVKMGENEQLEFKVSSIIDTAGHEGPSHAAKEIARLKPSMVIVMLSASDPFEPTARSAYSIESWLNFFLEEIVKQRKDVAERMLKKCFFVVNKTDLAAKSRVKSHRDKIKPLMRNWLGGKNLDRQIIDVPILTCTLVAKDGSVEEANAVVEQIARELQRNGRKQL